MENKTILKNTLTWEEYSVLFNDILTAEQPKAPYDNPEYLDYTKLNNSRLKRWMKTGEINEELTAIITKITEKQTWYVITEHWCGDAAHILPFIYKMTELNDAIELKMILRDTEPYMIEDYLTNGGKSIPKVVIRNEKEEDLYTWGPRPKEAQELYQKLVDEKADFEKMKIDLQKWYNTDKGVKIQQEFIALLK